MPVGCLRISAALVWAVPLAGRLGCNCWACCFGLDCRLGLGWLEVVKKAMNRKTVVRRGFWLAIGAALGFSAKAIFVKLAYLVPVGAAAAVSDAAVATGSVHAVTLLALRMLFAAPLFLLVALKLPHQGPPLTWRQWLSLCGVGVAGYYASSLFDFYGLKYISAGLERLVLMTYPALTLLLGVLFLGKRMHLRDSVALLVMYLGIVIAFAHDLHLSDDRGQVVWGTVLIFAASFTYAIYLVGSGELIKQIGSLRFTAWAMTFAVLGTLTHYVSVRPLPEITEQPWQIYALAIGMAVFSTVIPVFMLNNAIRCIGAARTSLIGMLGPVITIALGWLILHEPLSLWQLAGAAMVVLGVILLSGLRLAIVDRIMPPKA